ncbi:MAG: hypothetical protein RLZZ385_395 [Pseudomonadota bacterium]|jgi:MOSC domain-containing protein YiiM
MSGKIEKIFITPTAGSRLLPVASVQLDAARGIVGDRYHEGVGTFSKGTAEPGQNLTLIEAEEIENFRKTHNADLGYGELRRNIVTRGVALNELIGKEFTINGIKLKGIEACQPCATLARLTHSAVLPDMIDRCGLRVAVLDSGEIKVGDTIETG